MGKAKTKGTPNPNNICRRKMMLFTVRTEKRRNLPLAELDIALRMILMTLEKTQKK